MLNYEEAMKETEARGIILPLDMVEIARNNGIHKLFLLSKVRLVIRSCDQVVSQSNDGNPRLKHLDYAMGEEHTNTAKSANDAAPENVAEPEANKTFRGSIERDAALTRVETDKRLALTKAWEENEQTKADNKACKRLSSVEVWENSKRAYVEAKLKKFEEKLEKKKAEYGEQMKNKIADIHREAEEKKAIVEAKKGEQFLQVEEAAAKYRAAGYAPKKIFACFSS